MATLVNPSSKTFWAGIGMIGYGIFEIATGDPAAGIDNLLEGFAIVFMRHAIAKGG